MVGMAVGALLLGGCASGKGSDSSGVAQAPESAGLSALAAPSKPPGNGIADLEPAGIVGKAKAALAEAKSFRFGGIVHSVATTSTHKYLGTTSSFDFKVRGSDLLGTLTIDAGTVELLRVGKKEYIRPDEAFWTADTGSAVLAKRVMAVLKGRWVLVPSKIKDFEDLFRVASTDKLLDPTRTYVKGGVQTIDGKQAIAITDSGSDPRTLFVAVEGAPYPLRWDGGIQLGGTLSFSDFGADFTDLKAPRAAKVVDLRQLAG